MAKLKTTRYNELRSNYFTVKESRAFAILPKKTPALQAMMEDRIKRRARFEHLAATKIAKGKWRRSQVKEKWQRNLQRMYAKRGWRVQYGPTGNQPSMHKGESNPWAMYRSYEKQTGGKNYTSPWEIRQLSQGTTRLEKGLIFVQTLERKARKGDLNEGQIVQWINEKNDAINAATGKRKEKLLIERNRLERLLKQ